MLTLAPTSELEAVNELLAIIGVAPINTLENVEDVDATLAHDTLQSISRAVQSKGWHFNTEKSTTLVPSLTTEEIVLPNNCLKVDTVGADKSLDVVQRGTRLYDRKNHTYKFDRSITVDMVLMLPFEELPEAARFYITIRAGRVFQARMVGSATLGKFAEYDEYLALANLRRTENENADYNILSGSYDVVRVLDRMP